MCVGAIDGVGVLPAENKGCDCSPRETHGELNFDDEKLFLAMNYNFSIFHFASLPTQTNFHPCFKDVFLLNFSKRSL
jgi:hypothetical protein